MFQNKLYVQSLPQMNNIKTAIASVIIVALAAGYGLSQRAFFTGTPSEYSSQIDQPVVRWIALLAIVLCLASVLFQNDKDRSEN